MDRLRRDPPGLNPAFFKIVYTDILNSRKTESMVKNTLSAIDAYIDQRAANIFAPIIDHLRRSILTLA